MAISVFDLFKIGIGPSSSHTVGPMRAARQFVARLEKDGLLAATASVKAEMFGSLGATGKGHGTDTAVLLGLQGEYPDLVDTDAVDDMLAAIRADKAIRLLGSHVVPFVEGEHLILHKRKALPYHPNGMIFEAFAANGDSLSKRAYYSVGGGFVVDEAAIDAGFTPPGVTELKHPFKTGAELLALCQRHGKSISQIMLENELAWRSEDEVRAGLLNIWQVMQSCVKRGCEREGILPGGMKVKRRAADMYQKLLASPEAALRDPLTVMDWVNLYALAVNEENAAGGRVVTAANQRCRRHHPGGDALLRPLYSCGQRRRHRALFADSRRHRHPVQAERVDLGRRSGAARAKWARLVRWPPVAWPKCWAARRSKWKTPPKSAWNTTWA